MIPLFLTEKGKIWKALCVVSLSTKQNPGNISIQRSGNNEVYTYNPEDDYWTSNNKIELSNRERDILHYSIRGFTINEISWKLFISPDTVKFLRKKIFEKFNVANIGEAISFATMNKLI